MADSAEVFLPREGAVLRARRTFRSIRRLPVIPVVLLLIVVVAGITAPWISPSDPNSGNLRNRNLPPAWMEDGSTDNLLGTDQLGRDLLSRTIHGARISLIMAAVTLGIGGTLGVLLGLLAGWYGRLVDEIIMRLVDIELAIPLILVALVLVTSLGQSLNLMVAILAIWIWPRFARMVRGEVLRLKTMDYVALARVSGASTPRIMLRHLLPGTINTVIIVATLQVGIVILVEASLSFLGAGVPPPTPAWGSMVADGRDRLLVGAWWIATVPGIAIVLTVMALNIFGDWLRDTLDPRLRQLE